MWYVATSASVTNGSTVVTINNGDDISNIQEKSALVFEDGSPVEVVKSYLDGGGNSRIQLARAWPYTTKTNAPLIIFPTDADFAAATAELRRVIDTLQVASTVEAQTGTDDEKIMTPLKVKQSITANTGTAAARNVGESSGNLMEVGAGGLLGYTNDYSKLPTGADLNDVTITGFYSTDDSSLNLPGTGSFTLQVIGRADTYTTQIAVKDTGISDSQIFVRKQVAGSWTPWRQLYHTGNILGTVSQSGGVPTGAIIESGSNSNGRYTKFADGTVHMWGKVTYPDNTPITTQSAGGFRSIGLQFSTPLSGQVSGSWSFSSSKTGSDDIFSCYGSYSGAALTIVLQRITSGTTGVGAGINWQVSARWY